MGYAREWAIAQEERERVREEEKEIGYLCQCTVAAAAPPKIRERRSYTTRSVYTTRARARGCGGEPRRGLINETPRVHRVHNTESVNRVGWPERSVPTRRGATNLPRLLSYTRGAILYLDT